MQKMYNGPYNRKGYLALIMIFSFLAMIFLCLLIGFIDFSIRNKDAIIESIFPESPIFNLTFKKTISSYDRNYVDSFYEFKGRKEINEFSEVHISGAQNITKIYGHYFVYNKVERNFLDYLKEYSVGGGETCPNHYKKCGILNTQGRILCVPENEECPLNDFAISSSSNDANYNGYQNQKVIDSLENIYYFYYTNTKTDNKIITKFKLSKGYPCMLPTESSWIQVFSNEVEKDQDCKTDVGGKYRDEKKYVQINGNGITIKSLYKDNGIDINDADRVKIESTVNLYTRNFDYKTEGCTFNFISDLENEEKASNKIQIAIICLCGISAAFFIFLTIFSFIGCCCFPKLNFPWSFLIMYIYGFIEIIISIILSSRMHLKYTCDEEKFNNMINNDVNYNLDISLSYVLVMGIISVVFMGSSLIFFFCLKKNSTLYSNLN